jgi:TetR/AcrR family transcriptional regulator, regulator of autoinduction and epiphytic fitness
MPEPVNPKPTLRAEQAAVTRRRISDAARLLFVRDGYGATTLQAIADEAGVAVQTVYAVYRSKPGILRELRDAIVFQPEAEERYREAMAAAAAGDPGAALDAFARSIRIRWEMGADVVLVSREAGSTDTGLRAEANQPYERRRGGLRALVDALGTGLRPGLAPDDALAALDALTLPDVYVELVGGLGWADDVYEAWLARSLRRLLLEDEVRPAG